MNDKYKTLAGSKVEEAKSGVFRLCTTAVAILGILFGAVSVQAAPLSEDETKLLQVPIGAKSYYPSEVALRLASKIGNDANIDGIRAIIKARNIAVLWQAVSSFNLSSSRVVPEPFEALIIEHFDDQEIRRVLVTVLGRRIENNERFPKYQSRQLFDLLYTALKTKRIGQMSVAREIVSTDLPGIEESLATVLNAIDVSDAMELIDLFGRRKYAGAVSALKELQGRNRSATISRVLIQIGTKDAIDAVLARLAVLQQKPGYYEELHEVAGILGAFAEQPPSAIPPYATIRARLPVKPNDEVQRALGKLILRQCIPEVPITTNIQARKAADCIVAVGDTPSYRVSELFTALSEVPREIDIDFERMRRMFPRPLNADDMPAFIQLMARRKEAAGLDELFSYLPQELKRDTNYGPSALSALLAFPDPKVWQRVKLEIEKQYADGEVKKPRYDYVMYLVDSRLRDTAQSLKEIEAGNASIAMQNERHRIKPPVSLPSQLSNDDVERYVREAEAYLVQLGAVAKKYSIASGSEGLRVELNRGYMELGDLARFRLRDAKRAIAFYSRMNDYPQRSDRAGFGDFLIGEVYQFDLNDRQQAAHHYGNMLTRLNESRASANGMEAALENWWQRALRHDLAYLNRGKTFSGKLDKDDLAGCAFFGSIGASVGDTKNTQSQATLALPRSRLKFVSSLMAIVPTADENAIIRFAKGNDPAGYWAACVFGAVLYQRNLAARAQSPPNGVDANSRRASAGTGSHPVLMRAAASWLKSNGISLSSVDERKSSPEATWRLFLKSLEAADVETALGCLTPGLRTRFEQAFKASSPQQLREMAQSFVEFSKQMDLGNIREALVVRKAKDGKQRAALIYFVEEDGEWVIQEM